MDVREIKNHLIDNPCDTHKLLEEAGFHHITTRGGEIRCARDHDTNPTSVRVIEGTLASTCFSTNVSGDIITLIGEKLSLGFRDVLKFIMTTLGLSGDDFAKKILSYLSVDSSWILALTNPNHLT